MVQDLVSWLLISPWQMTFYFPVLYFPVISGGYYCPFFCGSGLVTKLCLILVILWTRACQDLLSKGFSRQEYWSGLPFPSLGDLPKPGIEPWSPSLQADIFTNWAMREAHFFCIPYKYCTINLNDWDKWLSTSLCIIEE